MVKLIITLLVFVLSGCSTYSSNLQVGNNQEYVSLNDQREAIRTVIEYDTVPEGAIILGKVDAGRCHRSFVENSPDESLVIIDLKVSAYAKGADGITNIKIDKKSGLSKNCWYILNGEATMFKLPKR
jgi:hypothetical protein